MQKSKNLYNLSNYITGTVLSFINLFENMFFLTKLRVKKSQQFENITNAKSGNNFFVHCLRIVSNNNNRNNLIAKSKYVWLKVILSQEALKNWTNF